MTAQQRRNGAPYAHHPRGYVTRATYHPRNYWLAWRPGERYGTWFPTWAEAIAYATAAPQAPNQWPVSA